MNTQVEAEKDQEQDYELTAEELEMREVVLRRMHELLDDSRRTFARKS